MHWIKAKETTRESWVDCSYRNCFERDEAIKQWIAVDVCIHYSYEYDYDPQLEFRFEPQEI